jgi:N-carbamoyl-L-amino-acid hydrolase
MSELTKMRVNLDRIKADVETLASIGRCDEDQGLYRMAFTDADIEARKWLLGQIDKAGLISRSDGAANIFGVLASDHDSPSLVVGSHLDTVPCAGSLDGSLGVVVGLECLRVINQAGYLPDRDIELVAFSDEEGRFGGMLGSEAFIGNINPLSIQHASDASGFSLS